MKMLRRLWGDEVGFVVSTELVLVATMLVIGMIVGLATVRDVVVQELGDLAVAVGNVNQSFTYTGVSGHTSATAGSNFQDEPDFCDPSDGDDVPNAEPGCIDVEEVPIDEGYGISPNP